MHLGHIAKNRQKTHNQAKYAFFYLTRRPNITFNSIQMKNKPILTNNEFLANFWQYYPGAFFGLDRKTKNDFFFTKISLFII